jgi:hypothetical protein
MRQSVIAEILAPVAQVVRFRHAGFFDVVTDAVADMTAIDRQHRFDISVARWPDHHGRLV